MSSQPQRPSTDTQSVQVGDQEKLEVAENALRCSTDPEAVLWLSDTTLCPPLPPAKVAQLNEVLDLPLEDAAPPGSPLAWLLWEDPPAAGWRRALPSISGNLWESRPRRSFVDFDDLLASVRT